MDPVTRFLAALTTLPKRCVDGRLVRCVTRDALEESAPPEFLFTSGKPNRYNPAGLQCVYFSENLDVAILEYSRYLKALGADEPFTTYFADAKLPYVDLTDPDIPIKLELVPADLHEAWRLSSKPTMTQLLGLAVSRQKRFAAIKYPSDAAKAEQKVGSNYVIFRDSMEPPAVLRVLTGRLVAVQQWP
jgi:RES domain-containing protein